MKKETRMKRWLIIMALMAFVLTIMTGCGSQKAKTDTSQESTQEVAQENYIGIISAMDNEIKLLLSEAKIDHVDTNGDTKYHVGTLRNQPVIITKAGIGKVRASSAITTMLDKYPASKVIFTGIAGGVADETQVLDEVIATDLIQHDYGLLTNDGFVWTGGDPAGNPENGEHYKCDPTLVDLAYNAACEVVGKEHSFKGTIASGDQFIASEEYVNLLQKQFNAYACEMEGAAIAVVCIKYDVPFVVIRALSDKADGKAHESYTNMGDIAADHSSSIVLKMLENIEK